MTKVRPRIDRCGKVTGEKVNLSVRIRISKTGQIRRISPKGGSQILRDCVKRAIQQAEFDESQKDFAITYPISFR